MIISKAESSISEAVKKAKNELKNTLSDQNVAMLIGFDSIEFAVSDGHPVMKLGEETIALRANENYPDTADVLKVTGSDYLKNGALLGELFYIPEEKRIYMCPVSIVTEKGIMRLC